MFFLSFMSLLISLILSSISCLIRFNTYLLGLIRFQLAMNLRSSNVRRHFPKLKVNRASCGLQSRQYPVVLNVGVPQFRQCSYVGSVVIAVYPVDFFDFGENHLLVALFTTIVHRGSSLSDAGNIALGGGSCLSLAAIIQRMVEQVKDELRALEHLPPPISVIIVRRVYLDIHYNSTAASVC